MSIKNLKVNQDPNDPTMWQATMTVGMAIANTRPTYVLPITPEMRESIQAKADEAGMSFEEYFDRVIKECNNL